MSEGSLELPLEPTPEPTKGPRGRRVIVPPKPVDAAPEANEPTATIPSPKTRPRLEPVSAYFLISFAVGTAIAFTGWIDDPLTRKLSFLGPIFATFFYSVGGYFVGWSNRPRLREKFADNCYYLGFIFTQVSLVLGFAPIALFGRSISAEDVLRFFGTALGSSLIGLIARTVFTQVADTSDVDDEVEELAKEVTRHSKLILEQFQSLLVGVGRGHEEAVASLESTSLVIGRALGDFEAVLAKSTQHLAGSGQAVEAASTSLQTRAREHEADLTRAVREAQAAISSLQADLSARVGAATSSIDETTRAIGSAVSGLQEFPKLAPLLAKSEASANAIETELASLRNATADAVERVSGVANDFPDQLGGTVSRVAQRLEAATTTRVEGFEGELDSAVTALNNTLLRFKAELERINVG